MKLTILLLAGAFSLVHAFPPGDDQHWHGSEPKGHEFRPPGPYDSRSPCPGLNALANHGYLPRDGKYIDLDKVNNATGVALNFAPDVFKSVVQDVADFGISTTGDPFVFHLRDLARHKAIEQDGSQTRNDIFSGDALHFDATIFDIVAKTLQLYDESKSKYVTFETAAKARAARLAEGAVINPIYNATAFQEQGSIGTTGLYLLAMWDDKAGAAPKPWVHTLLAEDRLPYSEGFKKPEKVKTGERLGNFVKAVGSVPV